MCVNPRLTVSHYRPNQDKLFAEAEDNLLANGWQWEFPEYQTRGSSGESLVKNAGGVRLTATLYREWMSSVDVVLEAPPMHLGESGFSSP